MSRPQKIALTLTLGAVGGTLFNFFDLPLAWMLGALTATTLGSLSGLPLARSSRLQKVVLPILGVMLGSAFSPEVLSQAGRWAVSLGALLGYVVIVTAAFFLFLRHWTGFDRPTAFFSASPGGFAEMVLLGEAMGGNDRQISLIHSIRILIIVSIIPFWFRLSDGYEPGTAAALTGLMDIGLQDAAILLACAAIGAPLASRIGIPAAGLIGPTALSAITHLLGWTAAQPPFEILAVAQVILGAGIGSRFAGVKLGEVTRALVSGLLGTAVMLAAAVALANWLSQVLGLPFGAVWLALAPGGLAEMTLISLTLNMDTAFVSTHHMVRMLFMVGIAPVIYRLLILPPDESNPGKDKS